MIIPQPVWRELVERLSTFEPPPFGKVKIEVEMNYRDAQLNCTNLSAYFVETLKA